MPIANLARELAREQTHIVVFGPGYGESIAVYVPSGGWLVTDSLTGRGRWPATFVPAVELLRERGEKAALVVLTHPHDDHVGGFDRLVTSYADGPVGLLDIHLPERAFTEGDAGIDVVVRSGRAKALAAILRYWRENPHHEWWLRADGSTQALGAARVEVLHPSPAFIDAGIPNPSRAPNSYSTPLLVEWGQTRLVLGADLPTREWSSVLSAGRTPSLSDHSALKAAHHGSVNAQSAGLVLGSAKNPEAVLTPWNLGRRPLPDLAVGGGVDWLLQRRPGVALTAIGRSLTARLPQPVTLTQLADSIERRKLPGGGTMDVKHDYDPDESWVAFSFDENGSSVTTRYGREARRVEA